MNISGFLRILISAALFYSCLQGGCAEAGATSCDIQRSSCTQSATDGITIGFDLQPKPVTAMSELTAIVLLSSKGTPLTDASVKLDLSMPGMFMGLNRPVLRHKSAGRYEGNTVITRCASGNKTWKANITIERNRKTYAVDFIFEVR